MRRLAEKTRTSGHSPLTDKRQLPFVLAFRDKLQNGYTFEEMRLADLKVLQTFMDKVSHMSFREVEKLYLREPDSQDTYQGEQVVHYGFGKGFRIHGITDADCSPRLKADGSKSL